MSNFTLRKIAYKNKLRLMIAKEIQRSGNERSLHFIKNIHAKASVLS